MAPLLAVAGPPCCKLISTLIQFINSRAETYAHSKDEEAGQEGRSDEAGSGQERKAAEWKDRPGRQARSPRRRSSARQNARQGGYSRKQVRSQGSAQSIRPRDPAPA